MILSITGFCTVAYFYLTLRVLCEKEGYISYFWKREDGKSKSWAHDFSSLVIFRKTFCLNGTMNAANIVDYKFIWEGWQNRT